MDGKKISFGFGKTTKKTILQPIAIEKDKEKIEFIDCLEGQSIKIVGKEIEKEPDLLVIPLREEDKINIPKRLAKLKEINQNIDTDCKPENETLEQRAAREILEDLKQQRNNATSQQNFAIALKPEDLPLDGAKEATIEDYESIPIAQFGLAMLRGMGWKDEANEKKKEKLVEEGPIMRPKGMGLGADRMAKQNAPLIAPSKDEVLEMKKGAFVKIVAGKHKDFYGQIEGLDEDSGRVIVKFALGGARESLHEFMVQLVSKAEFAKYSKILNSQKYDEFKSREHNIKEEKQERKIKERLSSSPEVKKESENEKEDGRKKNYERYDERDKRDKEKSHVNRHKDVKEHERNREERRSYSKSPTERESRLNTHHRDDRKKNERNREARRSYSNSPSRKINREDDRDKKRDRNQRRSRSNEDDRYHKSSSYKKKSHKYKQRRDRSHNRYSSEDDKKHKKKTKRSKKPRSRSR